MEIKGMNSTMPGKYSGIKPSQASQKKKPSDDLLELLKEKKKFLEGFEDQSVVDRQQLKEENKQMKILLTCLEISKRITAGDKVPPKDYNYLRKHDPSLYGRSMSMRIPKSNPRKYKQLSPNEKSKPFEFGAGSPVAKLSETHQTGSSDSSASTEGGDISLDIKI